MSTRRRRFLYGLALALSALLVGSCGGTIGSLGPACPLKPPKAPRGGKLFQMDVPGQYNAATRMKAYGQALARGLREIGVEVSEELITKSTTIVKATDKGEGYETTEVEEYNSSVKLRTLEVRRAKAEYCSTVGETSQVRAYVTIPGSEWGRLARAVRGLTALFVGCSMESEGGCRPEIKDAIRNAAKNAGMDIAHHELRSADALPNAKEAVALGIEHGAAWVLLVSLRSKVIAKGDPVFAETRALATLVETSDGKTIRAWQPGRHPNNQPHRYKGSAYPEYTSTPEQDAMFQSLGFAADGVDRNRACDPKDTFCDQPGIVHGMRSWESLK